MTPEERNQAHLEKKCARLREMDKLFNRPATSTRHHDWCCVLHRTHEVTLRISAAVHPYVIK